MNFGDELKSIHLQKAIAEGHDCDENNRWRVTPCYSPRAFSTCPIFFWIFPLIFSTWPSEMHSQCIGFLANNCSPGQCQSDRGRSRYRGRSRNRDVIGHSDTESDCDPDANSDNAVQAALSGSQPKVPGQGRGILTFALPKGEEDERNNNDPSHELLS
jgi:hypothetical protein